MNYLDTIEKEVNEYYKILEPKFPQWLEEYINTEELLRQQYISVTCGTIYSKLFGDEYFFSNLNHSIAVALIVWHFTHDKKQTLAGLFHDIATPVLKHCIDFMNGDYMTQESTEDLTKSIILNSEEIVSLLKRDGILLEEVCDYHIYPIADNDTPMLSADRLEYSMSNAIFTYVNSSLLEAKDMYDDIEVQKNEQGELELSFKTKNMARRLVEITSELSVIYRDDRTRYSMQFMADVLKEMSKEGIISKQDLYTMKEQDVITLIEKSKYSKVFDIWKNASKISVAKNKVDGIYCVHQATKVRYINPLVNGIRISKVCETARRMIADNLSYDMSGYVYLEKILESDLWNIN